MSVDVTVWTPVPMPVPGDGERSVAVVASAAGICAIRLEGRPPGAAVRHDTAPVLREAARQLEAYFAGELRAFDLPLDLRGTPFQVATWSALLQIPYGQTRSYSQIAAVIRAPLAVRAVGAANGQNPIPIVVPCHRVIGSNGKLVGYGGGLPVKRYLLKLESAQGSITA